MKENFDRFNFAFYKEKEMADFRRWLTAIAVMALFVGLASAQGVGTTGGTVFSTLSCSVNTTVTPTLRNEGFTEQVGDIVITCTGGAPVPLNQPVPTADITVFFNAPAVTSRLLASNGTSDALLLIDEPQGLEVGYGPSLPQIACGIGNSLTGAGPNGCVQSVGTVGGTAGVAVQGTGGTSGIAGANVFNGVASGQSVTFFGIPVLPPVTAGISRVFRITNVRVNANGAGGGVAGGPGQVNASISISPFSSLPITNPNPIVAFINPSLKTAVSGAGSFPQCNATTAFSGFLQYTEQFPTAFKTRVDGQKGAATNNFTNVVTQNTPGLAYNSESGLILNGAGTVGNVNETTTGGFTAGLADYGTRLKAIFSNIPTGVTVYVSTVNVTGNANLFAPVTGAPSATGSPFGTTTASSYAVLLTSETASDSAGSLPIATATTSFNNGSATNSANFVAFTSQGLPIVATWEVVNTQPTSNETISFAVFIGYSNVTQTFPPAPTTGAVTMTYAPTPTNGAFSATNGGTTAVNNLIPRFADTSTGASTLFSINQCSTTLLFPYITTVTGFDTGIVIANTTNDPFKTTNQQGTCALNWYQGANNPAQTVTPVIATGTIYANNASATGLAGQGFSGYMIAVCNFQLAHGVAEVMDVGVQHLLSAYLALVVTTGTGARNIGVGGVPENLNN